MKTSTSFQTALLLISIFFQINFCEAQTYANTESHGSNVTCIACVVSNAENAVDGNDTTYSTVVLTVGTEGAYVYQKLQFPSDAPAGEFLSIEIEGPGLATLDAAALACLQVTTYNDGVSNGDTQNSSQFTIAQIGSSSKYMLNLQPPSTFDEVELKMVAGTIGALTQLRIYFSIFSSQPLPVELLYFKGIYSKPSNILEWATAGEWQNDYFTIEKSRNGIDFEELVKIKGAGTSHDLLRYHYNDENPFTGNNFYRLKQTDMNGHYHYSSIISVRAKCIGIDQFAFGPNPVVDYLNIFYGSENDCMVEIKIMSMDGVYVYHKTIESVKGLNILTINDLGNLDSGMYNLYVISGTDIVFKRIVKI